MIESILITHAEYGLKEREQFVDAVNIDKTIPHVLLNTCNRMELYRGEGETPEHVIRHLYRVAAGLESSLIGERAIQGQLKQAYRSAAEKYRLSPQLNRLFQSAIHTGKRVRSETKIAEGAVSHSQVTVEILKQEKIDLNKKIVGIIGVNKLTEDILKFLVSRGAVNIFLSNRNYEKAQTLAQKYNGTAICLNDKHRLLEFVDVLICATSAPHTIVYRDDMPHNKEMWVFDLAFPRDVEESIGEMESVKLFNLEDIERFAKENISLRSKEINKAEKIINDEIAKFRQWQSFIKQKTL